MKDMRLENVDIVVYDNITFSSRDERRRYMLSLRVHDIIFNQGFDRSEEDITTAIQILSQYDKNFELCYELSKYKAKRLKLIESNKLDIFFPKYYDKNNTDSDLYYSFKTKLNIDKGICEPIN